MPQNLKTTPDKSRFSSRRTHRKSRLGCVNCKQRHIKCDERQPSCLNCTSRSMHCVFKRESPAQIETPSPSHPAGRLSPELQPTNLTSGSTRFDHAPGSDFNTGDPRCLDICGLELLHHWTSYTCDTLSQDPETQICWRINIPQLGFTFDFVLQGLLALSALHIARFNPDRREYYNEKSAWYWEMALRGASATLADPRHDSGSALYAFAVTSCFYTLASGPKPGDFLIFTNAGTADWLILFRGIRSLVELSGSQILRGPLAPLSNHALRQLERWEDKVTVEDESSPLSKLQQHINNISEDEPNFLTYKRAVDSLAFCFSVVSSEEKLGRGMLAANFQAFLWLYRISDDFVLCLQQWHPMALVIYAHFVVLIKTMDWSWIIDEWPSHLLSQIYESVDESWRAMLQWPIEQVG